MIAAAIDIGTNSVKLLVARNGRPLLGRSIVTRLGEGLHRTGRISPRAAQRTLRALARFRRLAARAGADVVVAVGTEAVRRAENGSEFARRCGREAGIQVQIIGAAREARLAFLGATLDLPFSRTVSVDIGGGSTQLSVGRAGRLERHTGLRLGAVTLTEKYLASDPPGPDELTALRLAVRARLRKVAKRFRTAAAGSRELVGIGGTAVNVAAIAAGVDHRRHGEVHGRKLSIGTVERIFRRLAALPIARRRKVRGLDPRRADIVVAGAAILLEVARFLGFRAVRVTTRGLRHGLIVEAMNSRAL